MDTTFETQPCIYGTMTNIHDQEAAYSPLPNTSINRLAVPPGNFSTPNIQYAYQTPQYYVATPPPSQTTSMTNSPSPITYMEKMQQQQQQQQHNAYGNYQIITDGNTAYQYQPYMQQTSPMHSTYYTTPQNINNNEHNENSNDTSIYYAPVANCDTTDMQQYYNNNGQIPQYDQHTSYMQHASPIHSTYYAPPQNMIDHSSENSNDTSIYYTPATNCDTTDMQQYYGYNQINPYEQQMSYMPPTPPMNHNSKRYQNNHHHNNKRNKNYRNNNNNNNQNNTINTNKNDTMTMIPQQQQQQQQQQQYYDDSDQQESFDGDESKLACTVCRGRRMCFCYFLKVRYYKFPSYVDLVDYHYKKWRSNAEKQKVF